MLASGGLSTDTTTVPLVAAGDDPERLKSGAAIANLCRVAPIPASSGKALRHRLDRGRDQEANRALYMIAVGRTSWDRRAYAVKRAAEGKSKSGIVRYLKRFIAYEVY